MNKKLVYVYMCIHPFTTSKNYIMEFSDTPDEKGKRIGYARRKIFFLTETISEKEYKTLEESEKLNFKLQKYDSGDCQHDYSMFDGDPLYNEDAGGNYNEGDGNSYPDYIKNNTAALVRIPCVSANVCLCCLREVNYIIYL